MKTSGEKGKRLLSVFLSAVMVAQMYSAPVQSAYASSGVAEQTSAEQLFGATGTSGGEDQTQPGAVDDASGGDADEQGAAGSEAKKGSADTGSGGSSEEGDVSSDEKGAVSDSEVGGSEEDGSEQVGDGSGKDANGTGTLTAASSSSADPVNLANESSQLAGNDALRSSGSYNPKAEPVDVSNTCTVTARLYSDSNRTQEIGTDSIPTNQDIYAYVKVEFEEGSRPTLAKPNISYSFPSNIKVKDISKRPFREGTTYAGE